MTWAERAEAAHAVLLERYRSGWTGLFRPADPPAAGDRLRLAYWWQAQALDALVDAQLRAPTVAGARRIRAFVAGLRLVRAGRLVNDYYDDVAWMALALLRADAVGAGTGRLARGLWRHLIGGWSDTHGGGISWSRGQRDYKNVPANGPAAILAARLHRRYGDPADLRWAQRIVEWIDNTLVDHATGLVWDGIGRRGDDHVDRDWLFTYTHGVLIGAHDELAALTGDPRHTARADATTDAVVTHLCQDGVLQDEGDGDGAMFRGICARYLGARNRPRCRAVLLRSSEAAWSNRDAAGRFGISWRTPPSGGSSLAAHLSGLFLCEQAAALERGSPGRGRAPAEPD
ncbi:glycoside hydrolase family 76 protein [Cryptosporangium aurantiacum]|uniref:Predicted alpha-1,6-mannanase, GH76 family n=1 Tax=Cryptosporangium aurantiacum TaxID=134849 RepID=A0A1M7RPF1_9ACTN|nr:glycoside hydrolase family 76 protein [Cryptosporangium aurantiacum]SHN48165.1 Predicted alpha-1,6-mannanase, GH76 family [Cryptosporangium aurantiacum]